MVALFGKSKPLVVTVAPPPKPAKEQTFEQIYSTLALFATSEELLEADIKKSKQKEKRLAAAGQLNSVKSLIAARLTNQVLLQKTIEQGLVLKGAVWHVEHQELNEEMLASYKNIIDLLKTSIKTVNPTNAAAALDDLSEAQREVGATQKVLSKQPKGIFSITVDEGELERELMAYQHTYATSSEEEEEVAEAEQEDEDSVIVMDMV